MISQQEIGFITHQVGMMFYMFLRSHEFLTEREELPVCIVFPRNSFFDLFPVHFRQSVIMVIARLFTGQAHYCVLCIVLRAAILDEFQINLVGGGQFGRKREK